MYLDAAGGNAAKATANWRSDQIAIAAAKQANKPDPNAPKPMATGQKIQIEQRKATALAMAEKNAQTRLAKIASTPNLAPNSPMAAALGGADTKEAVYADLAKAKQDAQDAYEAEIAAATGNAPGHFAYSAAQGAPPPPPQGAATGAPPPPPQQTGGGRGSPAAPPNPAMTPATPPAPAMTAAAKPAPAPVAPGPRAALPVAGQVKYLRGQAVKITKVFPDGSVDYVPVNTP